ncbi:hypothetical protein F4778DRAFT_713859 [Xylariomycetidae sp. FL2044]|nr:hypothetical protein F4778DRAFT_713859 [Xylariomycetidae sp. FL2044]
MLAARDQENRVFSHQQGAALKQQQGQVNRQLQPKTPGARYPKTPLKVPLNDENAARGAGPGKSVLGTKLRGNENALTAKGGKGANMSTYVTPMGPRTRAVLGDKTTNAKAKGPQTVNVKSVVREIEKSQTKAPATVKPKPKQPHAEVRKLEVHAEETDPLSEEEIEYCPPKPKDLPYESDVFPDGVLTFDALKPENLFKNYYQHYFDPIDEQGVSLSDRQLAERNRKAMEECDRKVKEDMDSLVWSIDDELDFGAAAKKDKASVPMKDPIKARKPNTTRVPLPTIRSRNAANALSMDDATKSLQRKTARPAIVGDPPKKKTTSFAVPGFRAARQPTVQPAAITRKKSLEIKGIEADSRATIGYNKGRAAASLLAQGRAKPRVAAPKATLPRSGTTLSDDSDKTITPARFANKQLSTATEDQAWRERVPFLSIFNPEDEGEEDDCDLLAGGLPASMCEEDEEEFEMKLAD